METIIMESLHNEGWNFNKIADGVYHTLYDGNAGKFIIQLNLINFSSSLILGTSYFPEHVEKNDIPQVAWQLNAINLQVSIGSFQIHFKTGEISYRAGIYFFNTPFQMNMVRNVLNAIVTYTNQRYTFISRLSAS